MSDEELRGGEDMVRNIVDNPMFRKLTADMPPHVTPLLEAIVRAIQHTLDGMLAVERGENTPDSGKHMADAFLHYRTTVEDIVDDTELGEDDLDALTVLPYHATMMGMRLFWRDLMKGLPDMENDHISEEDQLDVVISMSAYFATVAYLSGLQAGFGYGQFSNLVNGGPKHNA